jgi:hypothetical protein
MRAAVCSARPSGMPSSRSLRVCDFMIMLRPSSSNRASRPRWSTRRSSTTRGLPPTRRRGPLTAPCWRRGRAPRGGRWRGRPPSRWTRRCSRRSPTRWLRAGAPTLPRPLRRPSRRCSPRCRPPWTCLRPRASVAPCRRRSGAPCTRPGWSPPSNWPRAGVVCCWFGLLML